MKNNWLILMILLFGFTNCKNKQTDTTKTMNEEPHTNYIDLDLDTVEIVDLFDFYAFTDRITSIYQKKGMDGFIEFIDSTLVPGKVFWFSKEAHEGKFLIHDRAIFPIDEKSAALFESPILPLSKGEMDYTKIVSVFKLRHFDPKCQLVIYSKKVRE
jgi:hypothetical protein